MTDIVFTSNELKIGSVSINFDESGLTETIVNTTWGSMGTEESGEWRKTIDWQGETDTSFLNKLFESANQDQATKLIQGILAVDGVNNHLKAIFQGSLDNTNIQTALKEVLKSEVKGDEAKKTKVAKVVRDINIEKLPNLLLEAQLKTLEEHEPIFPEEVDKNKFKLALSNILNMDGDLTAGGLKNKLYTTLFGTNHVLLHQLCEKLPKHLPLDEKLQRAIKYLEIEERDADNFTINSIPDDILKISTKDLENIKNKLNGTSTEEGKQLIKELVFGKNLGAGRSNEPALIKPRDIGAFIEYFTKKEKEIALKLTSKNKELNKAYVTSKFHENQRLDSGELDKAGSCNRYNPFVLCRYNTVATLEENEKFLDTLYEDASLKRFTSQSNRTLSNNSADNLALSQMMQEYANCYNSTHRKIYRQSYEEIKELLKTQPEDNQIPCSPDEFRLLVHARINERRTGYPMNEARAILSDKKLNPEEKQDLINKYCENNKSYLLGCAKDNLNANQKGGSYSKIGAAAKIAFNNTIGFLITCCGSMHYHLLCKKAPSTTISEADATAACQISIRNAGYDK